MSAVAAARIVQAAFCVAVIVLLGAVVWGWIVAPWIARHGRGRGR